MLYSNYYINATKIMDIVPMEMCGLSMEQYIKKVVLRYVSMECGAVYAVMDGVIILVLVPSLSANN